MNREIIIRLAQEAHGPITDRWWDMDVAALERFAALVAAAERELIAQSLDKQADLAADEIDRQWAQEMAAVRARG